MRGVLVMIALALGAPAAHAQSVQDAVALLPLDADQRLEIYGQPVATEVARSLVAGGIDVMVVGPKMAVPERARLIVDGTITAGKGDTVALAVRIRDRIAGTVLDTLSATAPSLTNIDSAATDLSARVLPAVRARLAALHMPASERTVMTTRPSPTAPATPPALVVAVAGPPGGPDPFSTALTGELSAWARAHHREPKPLDAGTLASAFAVGTVAKSGSDLGVVLEVVDYQVAPGAIPMARARVRMRLADGARIAFDRVIVTDTIIGDRGLAPDALAARVAREVLSIAQPQVRRAIANWR